MVNPNFLDTNILIYGVAETGRKSEIAEQLMADRGAISIQVLNELASVLRRRFKMEWRKVLEIITTILTRCPEPQPITLEVHLRALRICERYALSIYDGLIVASALEAGCRVLYTEDLQHGQVIEGLRIENPFVGI
jgi:predicted nucleic acid-binding protein